MVASRGRRRTPLHRITENAFICGANRLPRVPLARSLSFGAERVLQCGASDQSPDRRGNVCRGGGTKRPESSKTSLLKTVSRATVGAPQAIAWTSAGLVLRHVPVEVCSAVLPQRGERSVIRDVSQPDKSIVLRGKRLNPRFEWSAASGRPHHHHRILLDQIFGSIQEFGNSIGQKLATSNTYLPFSSPLMSSCGPFGTSPPYGMKTPSRLKLSCQNRPIAAESQMRTSAKRAVILAPPLNTDMSARSTWHAATLFRLR